MKSHVITVGLALALVAPVRCADHAEAPRVTLPVVVDRTLVVPCTNDLGYTVVVTELRLVTAGVSFTVLGETHAAASPWDLLLPRAHAHPGHYAGGEVVGELAGPLVLDWFAADDTPIGAATLLAGDYQGANIDLKDATSDDGLAATDPLVGHGAYVAGHATKDARTVEFQATLALPDPAVIVGAPFSLTVTDDTAATLGLAFTTIDPFEQDTVFDGLDFFALDDARAGAPEDRGPLVLAAPDAAHNTLRRAFFTHDHFLVTTSEPR